MVFDDWVGFAGDAKFRPGDLILVGRRGRLGLLARRMVDSDAVSLCPVKMLDMALIFFSADFRSLGLPGRCGPRGPTGRCGRCGRSSPWGNLGRRVTGFVICTVGFLMLFLSSFDFVMLCLSATGRTEIFDCSGFLGILRRCGRSSRWGILGRRVTGFGFLLLLLSRFGFVMLDLIETGRTDIFDCSAFLGILRSSDGKVEIKVDDTDGLGGFFSSVCCGNLT